MVKRREPSSLSSGPYDVIAIGSCVNDRSLTSPRMPCAAPIWATQMRSVTARYRMRASGLGRRFGFGLGRRGLGCRSSLVRLLGLRSLLGLGPTFLARHRLLRV